MPGLIGPIFLSSTDLEHLGTTDWTNSFNGWFAIFHGYFLEVGYVSLGSAFNTINLHLLVSPPFFFYLAPG